MTRLNRYVVVLSLVTAGGCSSYYKLTDPATGKVFYTEEVDRQGSAVAFKDAQTGAVTTLQNSQVLEIDKKTFQAALTPERK